MAIPDMKADALRSIYGMTDWRKLMREGVIVRLTLRRWRAKTRLELADLGINVKDNEVRVAYTQIMQLGDKLLLPAPTLRELENIDSSARKLLDRSSYKTAFGRFVPYSAFEAWQQQNKDWEQRYYDLRDEIVGDYAGITWRLIQDYRHAGRQAWNILMSTTPEVLAGQEPEEFVEGFVARVRSRIPSPQTISDSFGYETNMMQVTFPTMIDGGVGEETPVSTAEVLKQQEEREQDRAAALERQRMLDRMNAAIVEDARRKQAKTIDTFLADLATQVRSLAYEVCTDVLSTIQGAPVLPGQSVRSLTKLIEQLQQLNYQNDRDITRMMEQIKGIVDQPSKERDIGDIRRTLRAIALVSRSTLMQLGETPRVTRDLDIPDDITSEDVRQARVELQIDQPVEVAGDDAPRAARAEATAEDVLLAGDSRAPRLM